MSRYENVFHITDLLISITKGHYCWFLFFYAVTLNKQLNKQQPSRSCDVTDMQLTHLIFPQ